MSRFCSALRLCMLTATASLMLAASARAQLAPPRTWPELKDGVQQRADRNAYPMTGMKRSQT